jgi:hypothetical protein
MVGLFFLLWKCAGRKIAMSFIPELVIHGVVVPWILSQTT